MRLLLRHQTGEQGSVGGLEDLYHSVKKLLVLERHSHSWSIKRSNFDVWLAEPWQCISDLLSKLFSRGLVENELFSVVGHYVRLAADLEGRVQ